MASVAAVFGTLDADVLTQKLAAADIAFARVNDAGRARAPSASAPHHGRHAERAGLLSGARRRDAPRRRAATAQCRRSASTPRKCGRNSWPRRSPRISARPATAAIGPIPNRRSAAVPPAGWFRMLYLTLVLCRRDMRRRSYHGRGSKPGTYRAAQAARGHNINHRRSTLAAVALIAALVSPSAAQAPKGVKVGVLTCNLAPTIGLIIGSRRRMSCVFQPDGGIRRSATPAFSARLASISELLRVGSWHGASTHRVPVR